MFLRTNVTRRRVLGAGVAGLGALALGRWDLCAAQAGEAEMGGDKGTDHIIDAHVHVWMPPTERYPLAAGFRREDMRPPSFTPEELMAHARPLGVRRVVLIQMSFYGYDNSYMLDVIAAHRESLPGGVFAGVAVIDASKSPAEEMKRLARLGVRGFRIRSDLAGADRWLDGEGMTAMWRCGAETGLSMCCLINPDALESVDRMCQRHPETPVVIDHFARIGIDGEIRTRDLDRLCRLARHKQVAVKVSAFYALGRKRPPYDDLAPMIRRLVETFGPQRLMWATDCPFQVDPGHSYAESLALVRERLDFLSAADRQWLLGKTASRVFFS
jgi:predicted TIM-barrel fold metal-dependent hydrolase